MSYTLHPIRLSGRSLAVNSACTPASVAAALVLILVIRAWGRGLRRHLPQSVPQGWMSAAYRARPVTFSGPLGAAMT